MFKILLSKNTILNIELDREGGHRMGQTGGLIQSGKDAPLAPRLRGGGSHCRYRRSRGGASGVGVAAPPPVIVKDRQLAVLAANIVMTTRR
jgi:hypothetical protein